MKTDRTIEVIDSRMSGMETAGEGRKEELATQVKDDLITTCAYGLLCAEACKEELSLV